MGTYWAGTPNYSAGNNGRLFLFPHWTAGGFDGSVSTLQNPNVQASAHYVIEGDTIAHLVNENDTAWHCGNGWYNWRSISYEMVGWPGNPPSKATLDTTAMLMAGASREWFGGAKLVLGDNVMLHNMVYATACPGESDIDYLLAKANEYLGGGAAPAPSPEPVAPEGGEGLTAGTYVCNVDQLNVRESPSTAAAIMASYSRGQTVNLDGWYTVCDGYVWGRYTAYSGAVRYVAVGADTGSPEPSDFLLLVGTLDAPSEPQSVGVEARSYTVQVDGLNIRSNPSTSAEAVASYSIGQSINLDGWAMYADGYLWGRYMGYSGNLRYVAIGTEDGSQAYLS